MAKVPETKIKGTENLSINGSLFYDLRNTFDMKLKDLMDQISSKGIKNGTINVKVDLELNENDSEYEPNTAAYIPLIRFKVTESFTEKSDEGGITGGANVQIFSEGKDKGWFVRNDPHGQMELDLD